MILLHYWFVSRQKCHVKVLKTCITWQRNYKPSQHNKVWKWTRNYGRDSGRPCFHVFLFSCTALQRLCGKTSFSFHAETLRWIYSQYFSILLQLLNCSAKKVFHVQQKYMVGKGRESTKDSLRITVTNEEINSTENSSVIIVLFY